MANPDHLQKLREGVAAWNQWRSENPDVAIDLHSADLRDAELRGANLREANISGCDLRDAVLDNADLSLSNLDRSNLKGARLRAASLSRARVTRAQLIEVDASEADFVETNLSSGAFAGARLIGTNMRKANCKDSNFSTAKLTQSDLTGTDFRDSNITKADFVGASLEGADLRRCTLNGVSFNSANLSNANLRRAELNHADLTDAILTHADLREVTGLQCEQLTQAQDWQTAYRDEALACGAAIPDPVATSATASDSVDPTVTPPSIVEFFGAGLSRWREEVAESERQGQLEKSRLALQELEGALTDLQGQLKHGQMGHNLPPEAMIPGEVFDQFIAEVRAGIALHDAPRPHKPRLSRLRDVLDRFRQWLQPRIDIAADSTAKAFGAAVGATVGAGAVALLAKLTGAWEQLSALINMLI